MVIPIGGHIFAGLAAVKPSQELESYLADYLRNRYLAKHMFLPPAPDKRIFRHLKQQARPSGLSYLIPSAQMAK
jgi:hypothetical protein